jgi:hypothetical protein
MVERLAKVGKSFFSHFLYLQSSSRCHLKLLKWCFKSRHETGDDTVKMPLLERGGVFWSPS